jgi:mono/diheme cytochrome c family protein
MAEHEKKRSQDRHVGSRRAAAIGVAACLTLVLGIIVLTAGYGCREEKAGGASSRRNLPPEMLFRLHCSECHGDGSGNGHRVPALKGKPKDLTTVEWQQKVTDDHLFRVISEGGPAVRLHGDMPAWGRQLSKRQIDELVEYIRTLADDSPDDSGKS